MLIMYVLSLCIFRLPGIFSDTATPSDKSNVEHALQAAANLATFGHKDTVIFVEPEERHQGLICVLSEGTGPLAPICRFMVRYNIDLFLQRPVLRQWLSQGKIYREASTRQSSRFELFFDLLFVGIVHQIAEATAEEPTGIGFAKYVLTFCPAFSVWGKRVLELHVIFF